MKKNNLVERREFLIGATTTLAAAAIPSTASAMKEHKHEHKHHHHGVHQAIVDSAEECIATGKTCLTHCLVLLGEGDTSMAECSKNVNEMIPVCEALATLALSDSKNLNALAQVCVVVCKDCAAGCKQHINDHPECKDCYDACNQAIEVLEAHLKAA